MSSTVIPATLLCMSAYEVFNSVQVWDHFSKKDATAYDPQAAGFFLGARTVLKTAIHYGFAYLSAIYSNKYYKFLVNDDRETGWTHAAEWSGMVIIGAGVIPLAVVISREGARYVTKQLYGAQAITSDKITIIEDDYCLWQQNHDNPV